MNLQNYFKFLDKNIIVKVDNDGSAYYNFWNMFMFLYNDETNKPRSKQRLVQDMIQCKKELLNHFGDTVFVEFPTPGSNDLYYESYINEKVVMYMIKNSKKSIKPVFLLWMGTIYRNLIRYPIQIYSSIIDRLQGLNIIPIVFTNNNIYFDLFCLKDYCYFGDYKTTLNKCMEYNKYINNFISNNQIPFAIFEEVRKAYDEDPTRIHCESLYLLDPNLHAMPTALENNITNFYDRVFIGFPILYMIMADRCISAGVLSNDSYKLPLARVMD